MELDGLVAVVCLGDDGVGPDVERPKQCRVPMVAFAGRPSPRIGSKVTVRPRV